MTGAGGSNGSELTKQLSVKGASAVAWNYSPDVSAASAKAIADCKAKGGTDPKIVWSTCGSGKETHWAIIKGAVAVSDNGTGTIVGWSFGHPYEDHKRAKMECLKKGGQNPKVVGIGTKG